MERSYVIAGAVAILVALAGGTGLILWAASEERPAGRRTSREALIYRALIDSDYSQMAEAAGLRFVESHGMLSPEEAERERSWLFYVGLEGRDGRHRISYQVMRPEDRVGAEEDLLLMGYDPCEEEYGTWECFEIYGGVAIQGEVACLTDRCDAKRRGAKRLVDAGHAHLEELLRSLWLPLGSP